MTVPHLAKALDDPEPARRLVAALELRQIGPRARTAVPMLLRALGDEHYMVRVAAVLSLAAIGPSSKVLPGIRNALRDDYQEVRHAAVDALGLIGPAAAEAESDLRALAAHEPFFADKVDHVLRVIEERWWENDSLGG